MEKLKLWNVYELEHLSKNHDLFIAFLNNYIKSHSVEETLGMIRVSGICFNIYNSKQSKLYKKVLSIIEKYYSENKGEIEKFTVTITTLNSIFDDFFALRASRELNNIPKKRQILSFMLSLEILLGSLNEYIKGHSLIRIKQVYPFVFSLFDGRKQTVVKAEKDINRVLGIADSIAEFAGGLFKFLGGAEGNLGKIETIRMDHVRISRDHIELFDTWSSLLNVEQKWRFFGADLVSNENDGKIHMDLKSEQFLKAQEISKVRFKSQKNKWFADFNVSNKDDLNSKIVINATNLPPNEYLCEDEAYFSIAIGEFLNTHNLEIKCLDVSLSEWIRAYMLIQIEAKKNLNERFASNSVKPLNIEEWTIVKKPDEWIDLFISRGISASSALVILNSFKFTKDSKDLLDCPFVVHNDDLIVIPSVASHIDPSMSLVSLLVKKNIDVSFKGTGLETEILSKLNNKGISAKRIKHIQNDETFECDAVFILDDELFFIELKAYGQPLSIREYYNFLLKLQGSEEQVNMDDRERSATDQLNRIVDFYSNNLKLVNKELKINNDWEPKKIHKVILTTAMLGESMFFDDCYIVDTSIFERFLDRVPPGFSIGKTFLKPDHVDFNGDITSEKLLNVMKTPPQIELGNIRVRKNYRSVTLESKTIQYPYFNDQLGDFIKYDKTLLQKLGIDSDKIALNKDTVG